MSIYQSMRGGDKPLLPWIRYCVPGKANLAVYVQGSRRFWQTASISGSRGFRALEGAFTRQFDLPRSGTRSDVDNDQK